MPTQRIRNFDKIFPLALALIAAVVSNGGPAKAASFNEGLLAYFDFEDQTTDLSGNGNDLVAAGNTASFDYTNGVVGKAGSFAGGGWLERTGYSMELNDFSTSLWVRSDSLTEHNNGVLSIHSGGFGFNGGDAHTRLFMNNGTGSDPQYAYTVLNVDGGRVPENGAAARFIPDQPTDIADWHHVTMTRKDGVQKLYVDGNLESEAFFNGDFSINNGLLRVGQSNFFGGKNYASQGTGGEASWKGDIDEVRIYSRAFTAREAKWLDNEGGDLANHLLIKDESTGKQYFFGLDDVDFTEFRNDNEIETTASLETAANVLAASKAHKIFLTPDYNELDGLLEENIAVAKVGFGVAQALEFTESVAKDAFVAALRAPAGATTVSVLGSALQGKADDFVGIAKEVGRDAMLLQFGIQYMEESRTLFREVEAYTNEFQAAGFDANISIERTKELANKYDLALEYFYAGQVLFNKSIGIENPDQSFLERLRDRGVDTFTDIADALSNGGFSSLLSAYQSVVGDGQAVALPVDHVDKGENIATAAETMIDSVFSLADDLTPEQYLEKLVEFYDALKTAPDGTVDIADHFDDPDNPNSLASQSYKVLKEAVKSAGWAKEVFKDKKIVLSNSMDDLTTEDLDKDESSPGNATIGQNVLSPEDFINPALFLEQASPVAVTFDIETPDEPFRVTFEAVFIEGSGNLSVFLEDILMAAFDSTNFTLGEANILSFLVTDERFFGLNTADLRFLWDEGEAGDLVQIDEITLTTVVNSAIVTAVPLPAPFLLLIGAISALGFVRTMGRFAA